jgi:hypothetical protein
MLQLGDPWQHALSEWQQLPEAERPGEPTEIKVIQLTAGDKVVYLRALARRTPDTRTYAHAVVLIKPTSLVLLLDAQFVSPHAEAELLFPDAPSVAEGTIRKCVRHGDDKLVVTMLTIDHDRTKLTESGPVELDAHLACSAASARPPGE